MTSCNQLKYNFFLFLFYIKIAFFVRERIELFIAKRKMLFLTITRIAIMMRMMMMKVATTIFIFTVTKNPSIHMKIELFILIKMTDHQNIPIRIIEEMQDKSISRITVKIEAT